MYLNRNIENILKRYSAEFPIVFLSGARQVGKSTLLKMIADKDMKYVSLDDLEARSLALRDPKFFLEFYGYPLLIDEIQYAPNLLPYIKIIVDNIRFSNMNNGTNNKCLFWLTGSQQFYVMNNINESLAGRVGVLNLYSFSLNEILGYDNDVFVPDISKLIKKNGRTDLNFKNIFERIYFGGMPSIVVDKIIKSDYFSSYVNTYINRDIKEILNVSDIITFYNFMQYLAVRTAQELNYSMISKELGLDSKTIKKWVSVLETSGIIFLLQPFSTNKTNRLIKSPKIYFMDTGLCTYLAKYNSIESLEVSAFSGPIFETFVVSEIIKNLSNNGLDPKVILSFYRDKEQKEIDLLFTYDQKVYPIEIKKGVNPQNADKNFSVLDKYGLNIENNVVICMTNNITPINSKTFFLPIKYI